MPGVQDTFDEIVSAHRVVREAVTALLTATDRAEALPHIERLGKVLPAHFAYEESENGYFAHLRSHLAERHHGAVDKLVVEHREMSVEVLALLEDDGDGWILRARRFAQKLKGHEQREARLGATPSEPGL